MCIHRGQCPQADMTCGRATICPLVSDDHNAYVGPLQGPFLYQADGENDHDTDNGTAFGAGQPFQNLEQ